MADGVVLLADRWAPTGRGEPLPIVLLRSPYGRRQLGIAGRLFAERGYQVVIQSCRGTFGSGGTFDPFRNERSDGHDTLRWLAAQPWFGGSVVTFGPSYLGLTQWAVGEDPPEFLRASAPAVTAANFHDSVLFPFGVFAAETMLGWIHQIEYQERPPLEARRANRRARRRLAAAAATVPFVQADQALVGRRVDFFGEWLAHDPADPWWKEIDFRAAHSTLPPAAMIGGWYDAFLQGQLDDFEGLQAAGRDARITIGPWTHTSPGLLGTSVREALAWFDAHVRPSNGSAGFAGAPVRLYVMGDRRWMETPRWPPPARLERWYLRPHGSLRPDVAPDSDPDGFTFDPTDPTPGVGGASVDRRNGGRRDQRPREVRDDVLTYTSPVFDRPLTIVGHLTSEIHMRTSSPNGDLFVRLCVVSKDGRSKNVSDGLAVLGPEVPTEGTDRVRSVRLRMWPSALTVRPGERLRLQVSGGAHPLFLRSLGTADRLGNAGEAHAVAYEIFHDAEHGSCIELPVVDETGASRRPVEESGP